MRGSALLAWIAAIAPDSRDAACERLLAVADAPPRTRAAHASELIGYYPSGTAPLVRAVVDVPIGASDVFVDLGSGLGKAAILVHLLTDATTRGIERDAESVELARRSAATLGLARVHFEHADAREADLASGTVFYLYLPFTGSVLAEVMHRLHAIAERRTLVVVTLGLDLDHVVWLRLRESDSFWLAIYESTCPGALAREPTQAAWSDGALAAIDAITREVPLDSALDV